MLFTIITCCDVVSIIIIMLRLLRFLSILEGFLAPLFSVDMTVSITPSGTNTAGETYSLVCSVTVSGSTDTPTITWLDPMNSQVPSDMVSTTGSMSTLTFDPLSASHAGTYTCKATLGGAMGAEMEEITVQGECIIITYSYHKGAVMDLYTKYTEVYHKYAYNCLIINCHTSVQYTEVYRKYAYNCLIIMI